MYTPEELQMIAELDRRLIQKAPTGLVWCPQAPTAKQQDFLDLDCFEALYGGAAGGGKSSCLLMAALQYVNEPRYSALILRRTYADLSLPGAIMDRAQDWLRGTGASWNDKLKQWRFPSGATLQFGYLETEKDKYRYQGSELQFVGVDELTQFTESQYRYLLSRLRRAEGSSVPLRARSASNPGGTGHEWVYKRFVTAAQDDCRFVPAKLDDNPHLDIASYKAALERLDSTTRAQLLEGLWVRDDNGLVYKYDDTKNGIDEPPNIDNLQCVLGIDLGASQSKPTTAFCVTAYHWHYPDHVWILESYAKAAMIPSTIADEINTIRNQYRITRIVADAGALGKGYIEEFRKRHLLPVEPAKKQDKLGYRKLLNGDLERGVLKIVRPLNSELIEEMQTLPWDEKGIDSEQGKDDHLSDSALYSWREAKYWLARVPEVIPKAGTPERAAYEEAKMKKQFMEQSKQRLMKRGKHVNILSD